MHGLVYVGKIIELTKIDGADFIQGATVICGNGGKWKGIVRKNDLNEIGLLCRVFLPDSLLPQTDEFAFMESSQYRVKMRRFLGAPSEVLIMPLNEFDVELRSIGEDLTESEMVTKFEKPMPSCLNGDTVGLFPSFIPKTDELNYQRFPDLVDSLVGKPFYVTEKCDGSSTTAYRYKGEFGLCKRNWRIKLERSNGYVQMALKYRLDDLLPEGYALQWETCGPGIQGNPMGLKEISAFAFSGYFIPEHRYLDCFELTKLCSELKFPMVKCVGGGASFKNEGIETWGEGKYDNGKQREGVVVRSRDNVGHAPISFKIINLDYEK